jgi:7,8-dihydropterin-6-yl-methyl-4-(beta-D-ribofuranosyl)aminobenzene 5'-phosphate synthase
MERQTMETMNCGGPAPLALNPVDRLEVLTVIDNVVDLLLGDTDVVKRTRIGDPRWQQRRVAAPLLESGDAVEAPVAEHGLSFLVSVTSGDARRTLLFDTGATVGTLIHNLRALAVDPTGIEAIVLSHGHFDHTTGLNGLAGQLSSRPPLLVHPEFWRRRRIAVPGREPQELPTTNPEHVRAAGFPIVESRAPSVVLSRGLLLTGEIERTTDFEAGIPFHEAWCDGEWQPDPVIADDQALVAHVRGRGLVVITGCGHAGVINTVRYACKVTGIDRVHAVLGGFHLSGPAFEPRIGPTVDAFAEFTPALVAPSHCTGWRAAQALAAAFPAAFVPSSVGTRYLFQSAATGP